MATTCPNCGSPRTRRGGGAIWTIYLVLIALALPLVLTWKFSAAIFAAVMLAIIVPSRFRREFASIAGSSGGPSET